MVRSINALDYGSYTITATAGSLFSFADSGSPAALPSLAKSYMGRLQDSSIRARGDATNPTATEGELIESGQLVILDDAELGAGGGQILFIRTGGVSGVLKGHFYNVEASVLIGGEG